MQGVLTMTEWDKVAHFLCSFVLGLMSPLLAVAAGIGKEAWDVIQGEGADALDLLADALGVFAAVVASPIW